MARKTGIYRRAFARVLAVALLIIQGVVLDYFLITGKGSSWFLWLITDVVVLAAWIVAMWMSHNKSARSTETEDELKFAYIAWIVYSAHLIPQVATLFKVSAHLLREKHFFGPNLLKMNLCVTPMLFLFLVFAHHDAKSHSLWKYYLEKMTAAVTLDLFDSVEMLEYLFDKEKISPAIENSILVFSCTNILLPTFALLELKYNKFRDSGEVSPISFKFIYICSFMFVVGVPFLVLRFILWHSYHLDISVLLAKNVLGIVMGLIEIVDFFGEQRARRCENCTRTFAKDFYKSHRKNCSQENAALELKALDSPTVSNGEDELKLDVFSQDPWDNNGKTRHEIPQIDFPSSASPKQTYV